MNKENSNIACIIPTYNGIVHLESLLKSLKNQTIRCDIIIVDSLSTDGTQDIAARYATHMHKISPTEFDHGGTRRQMCERHLNYEFFVFLTQDAILHTSDSLKQLLSPFADPKVGATYGRQIPHTTANIFAKHARKFNYPAQNRIQSIESIKTDGIKTIFLSNSFSAYRRSTLSSVGGFPSRLILGEDMYTAANMILNNWKIVYVSTAIARHSHNYSITEEFHRYFDTGVFHRRANSTLKSFNTTGSEGNRFVVSEILFLGLRNAHLWPVSLLRNFAKYMGYKLGKSENILPKRLKIFLSSHKAYWQGE